MSAIAAPATHDRRLVVWLSLGQLITWGSVFYGFALLMEPVEHELHITRAQSSLAFSLALLAEGLLAFPVGRLIDRGHERRVMTGGSVLVAVALLLHSAIGSLAAFYAVWTLLGVGMAATLYAPVFAVVTRRYPQDFRRAIITMTFLGGLASTVFIPLTSWLIHALGWRHALWVLAGIQVLVCVPLHAHWLRHAPRRVHALAEKASASDQRTLGHYLRSGPFLMIGAFVVLMAAVTSALPAHMISLLRESGLGEAWVVIIPASIGAIQVAGRLLLFFFEHRFDVHLANRLIPCLIPLGLAALLAGSGHGPMAVVFVLLYGLGNGMITIVKGTAIAQYVSRTHVASLNGALGIPQAAARAVAPLALGLLWSREAGYTHGLWLMLLLAVGAVAALWLAQRLAHRTTS